MDDLTKFIKLGADGDKEAESKAYKLLYGELRQLAQRYMKNEKGHHTLQPTALINEAYLRLTNHKKMDWQNRSHFLAMAATTMRRILVDSARQRQAEKRGDGLARVTFEEGNLAEMTDSSPLVNLDTALEKLSDEDPRKAKIVELKFFAGFGQEEIAEILSISITTVKRDWTFAKAWLLNELSSMA